jgi:hypothetical protein
MSMAKLHGIGALIFGKAGQSENFREIGICLSPGQ